MKNKPTHNRWQNLFFMCVAMAKGNFSYKIKRTKSNDELEAVVALHNMLAEELQETFKHHGFINPRRAYLYLSKIDILLDENFSILNFSREVPDILHIPSYELLKSTFVEILDSSSVQLWEETKPQLDQALFRRFSLDLNFKTGRELIFSTNCYITSFFQKDEKAKFIVSSFTPVILDESNSHQDPLDSLVTGKEEYRLPKIFNHQSDVRQMHKVRDYILQNLGKNNLDMKELTSRFFTNASKLKKDFKAIFGTTPFQFLKTERLNLARELIQKTTLPLKNVSVTCGFNNYPHFSFAFKEKFKISPQQLRNSMK